jgi:hypothetical protein
VAEAPQSIDGRIARGRRTDTRLRQEKPGKGGEM